ncbi:MAG: hypothetical protein RLZZ428_806 [Pseudomonadota bacterium]|jgi:hypothetical protein
MHLDLTPEAILTQLGYTKNGQTLEQINRIIANTKGFERFSQHLPSLGDALAVEKGFIAMSNSKDYLKIKCDQDSNADNLRAFEQILKHWSDKYHLQLEKIQGQNTYYLIGVK